MKEIVLLKEVSKKYRGANDYALLNINLQIKNGETVGIIGENGAGKSTLLKLISRDIEPTNGKILISSNVETLFDSEILSDPFMNSMSLAEQYLILKGYRGDKLETLKEIEKFCDIGERFYDPFYTLSLGMKARVQFAIKTSFYEEIVLIDEVLGAGDCTTSERSAKRIRDIAKNSTLMCVSHSLSQIRSFCSRCLWIKDRTIYLDGETEEIIEQYDKYMVDKIKSIYKVNKSKIEEKNSSVISNKPNSDSKNNLIINLIKWINTNGEEFKLTREINNNLPNYEIKAFSQDIYETIKLNFNFEIKSFLAISIGNNMITFSKNKKNIENHINSLGDGNWILFLNLFSEQDDSIAAVKLGVLKTNHSDPPILVMPSQICDANNKNFDIWQSSAC